jgi:hypothetical protein
VRPEGLGKLEKRVTSPRLEPRTFRLVAQRLNRLCYRVPRVEVRHSQIPPTCDYWSATSRSAAGPLVHMTSHSGERDLAKFRSEVSAESVSEDTGNG